MMIVVVCLSNEFYRIVGMNSLVGMKRFVVMIREMSVVAKDSSNACKVCVFVGDLRI